MIRLLQCVIYPGFTSTRLRDVRWLVGSSNWWHSVHEGFGPCLIILALYTFLLMLWSWSAIMTSSVLALRSALSKASDFSQLTSGSSSLLGHLSCIAFSFHCSLLCFWVFALHFTFTSLAWVAGVVGSIFVWGVMLSSDINLLEPFVTEFRFFCCS